MLSQILLFDIGNTSIKIGLASEQGLRASYILRTDLGQTSDSLGLSLFSALQHANCPIESIKACVCSSVVPNMITLVEEACIRYVKAPFLQVIKDISIPLNNCYSKPSEVGADRLVCAYAARQLFPNISSLIVVDFGTATTFDCIDDDNYLGGIIFPGVHTALAALSSKAAKLPMISLETDAKEPMPGKDTISSMQHGILFGFAAMVEGLSSRLAKQLKAPVYILGTGGFAKDIAKVSTCFHDIMPNLMLDGLCKLYYNR